MEFVELDDSLGAGVGVGGGGRVEKNEGGYEARRKKKGSDSQTPGAGAVNSGSLFSIDGRTVTGISTDGDAGTGSCISPVASVYETVSSPSRCSGWGSAGGGGEGEVRRVAF